MSVACNEWTWVGGWEDGMEGEGDREGSQRNVP